MSTYMYIVFIRTFIVQAACFYMCLYTLIQFKLFQDASTCYDMYLYKGLPPFQTNQLFYQFHDVCQPRFHPTHTHVPYLLMHVCLWWSCKINHYCQNTSCVIDKQHSYSWGNFLIAQSGFSYYTCTCISTQCLSDYQF